MADKLLKMYTVESDKVRVKVSIGQKEGEFVRNYLVNIPEYGKGTEALLDSLKKTLVDDSSLKIERMLDQKFVEEVKERFSEKALKILNREVPQLSGEERDALVGILVHEMLGLGKIEFLLADGQIEEIAINSAKEPIWIYHKEFGWLKTNVFLNNEADTQNYASIVARRVGKQITILNPLLDAHLVTGDRANATLFPISSRGNTITIRRFRREPWTVTDLIENKTVNSDVLALIWLGIQYELNMIISGGTASGKTSFMGICMPFIQPNHRVITIEDSVSGDAEIVYRHGGKIVKSTVGELIDGLAEDDSIKDISLEDDEDIEIPTMSKDGQVEWKKPSHFIRHWVKKDLLTITLKSGRTIKVTPDHSLFALGENGKISEIAGNALSRGSFIATPRICDWEGKKVKFDLRRHLSAFKGCFIRSIEIKSLLTAQKYLLKGKFAKETITSSIRNNTASMKMIEVSEKLPETGWVSSRLGTKLPFEIELDLEMARFAGLWLADGSYDKNSVLISIVEPEARKTVENIALRFGLKTKMHSDGITLMLNSKPFKQFMENVLELRGDAYTKKFPYWAFELRRPEVAAMLNGYFSGDGWVRKNDIAIRSSSTQLLKDTQTLLLRFGIPLRVKWTIFKDKTYEARISGTHFLRQYVSEIGFCIDKKTQASSKWLTGVAHDVSDVVPLPKNFYREIKAARRAEVGKTLAYTSWKNSHYRNSNIGRNTLAKYATKYPAKLSPILHELSSNDIFWDVVEKIERNNFEGFVYDFSVPDNESFICNNIVCHNTRELMLPSFLHWVPMTTREPNPEGRGGISMLDLLVNSLRMRPDRIIVGEIRRQKEAEVLFEAMHTGHSAYTTVHANTAQETIRRLTAPPIEIPVAMLEAVHLNVVLFRNRRLGVRRLLEIAEFIPEKRGGDDKESIRPNVLYRWRPADDTITKQADSIRLFDELSLHTGLAADEIQRDLATKKDILDWMVHTKIHDIEEVGKVMANFYLDESIVLDAIKKNQKPGWL
jgi:Flp pilus assembly CpaF family ATPase